ncbi:KINUA [Symbiodinium natans]|uniref:KINUA protein n=1 Tax=Symbiodinium natans TaxID=878477 RepID=A0A812NDX9_9DINO|nr:KINUA [Symbiodinium natans]
MASARLQVAHWHRHVAEKVIEPMVAMHSFEFSSVFSEETSQEQLFMPVAGQAVDGALQGRSGCIIAYGQTGSGKTYSIFGEDDDPVERGLLPRAMERLLHGCAQKAAKDGSELDGITVSFLEVYMDQVQLCGGML